MTARIFLRTCVLTLLLAGGGALAQAETVVYLTGDIAADFTHSPSANEIANSFSAAGKPLFLGFGWEVVHDYVGVGATYMGSFFESAPSQWWFDWYGGAIYVSLHLAGAAPFVDPFLNFGIGSGGRVALQREEAFSTVTPGAQQDNLMISIFPYAAAGLGLNLHNFTLGARLTYIPTMMGVPATSIPTYPLGPFQFTIYTGFSFKFDPAGWVRSWSRAPERQAPHRHVEIHIDD